MDIPANYVRLASPFANGGVLRDPRDQYGNPWDTELGVVFVSAEQIHTEGAEILGFFDGEDDYQTKAPLSTAESKYLLGGAYPRDHMLCFAVDGSDCPFCMDFRNSPNPEVIYWDDGVLQWRRVADTIADFFRLFEHAPHDGAGRT